MANIDILEQREKRQADVFKRLEAYDCVIMIKVNYPGNQKLNAYTFYVAHTIIKHLITQLDLSFDITYSVEGVIAITQSTRDGIKCKHVCVSIESNHPLGRLIDLDVYTKQGQIKRTDLGYSPRKCYICEDVAVGCVRSQKHPIHKIKHYFHQLVIDHARHSYQEMVRFAAMAELSVHPSFGLVTPTSSGIHSDMDVNTYLLSIETIAPYFDQIATIDYTTSDSSIFLQLRQLGIQIEAAMFKATQNINTHKGLIFLMLLVLGAVHHQKTQSIVDSIKQLSKPLLNDFDDQSSDTSGKIWYQTHGILGIRGLALDGLSLMFSDFIPYYLSLKDKDDHNDALIMTLLEIMSKLDDTTVLKRGGLNGLAWLKQTSRLVINNPSQWQEFSNKCKQRQISPGGSADVLAVVVLYASFFYDSNKEGHDED